MSVVVLGRAWVRRLVVALLPAAPGACGCAARAEGASGGIGDAGAESGRERAARAAATPDAGVRSLGLRPVGLAGHPGAGLPEKHPCVLGQPAWPPGQPTSGHRATGTCSAIGPEGARWHKRRHEATGSGSPPGAGENPDRWSAGGRGSLTAGPAGFVPQTFGLAPWLTAAENVALVMQVLGLPPDVVEQRTTEALEAIGLGAAFDRIVTELSGGQRQRVAVARALAAEPAVIIADEPTAELDAENRSLVLDLLLDATDAGAAVVLATHDPEVTRRCTRLLVLTDGRLVEAP